LDLKKNYELKKYSIIKITFTYILPVAMTHGHTSNTKNKKERKERNFDTVTQSTDEVVASHHHYHHHWSQCLAVIG